MTMVGSSGGGGGGDGLVVASAERGVAKKYKTHPPHTHALGRQGKHQVASCSCNSSWLNRPHPYPTLLASGSFTGCRRAIDEFRAKRGITAPLHYQGLPDWGLSGGPYEAVWWIKPPCERVCSCAPHRTL